MKKPRVITYTFIGRTRLILFLEPTYGNSYPIELVDEVAGEDDGGKDGVGEFEAGAGEEAEEGSPCCTEGVAALLAAEELACKGTDEGPEDNTEDACGTERQPNDANDKTYVAAPDTGLATSVTFGAEGGDDVV